MLHASATVSARAAALPDETVDPGHVPRRELRRDRADRGAEAVGGAPQHHRFARRLRVQPARRLEARRQQRVAVRQVGRDHRQAFRPEPGRPGIERLGDRRDRRLPSGLRSAECEAQRLGEQRRAAGGIGAALGPQAVRERDPRRPVGGGVEGFEAVDRLLNRRAVEGRPERGKAPGDGGIGVRLGPERAGEDRSPAWWHSVQTRRSAGSGGGRAPVVADDLLELEAAGGFVVADRLDHLGGGLVAEEEPVGEPRRPRPGRLVAGDRHDQPRRCEIVRVGGVALQRAAERDQRRLDVFRAGHFPQPVEERLERVGQATRKHLGQQRGADRRRVRTGRRQDVERRTGGGHEAGRRRHAGRQPQSASACRCCSPAQQSSATSSPRA